MRRTDGFATGHQARCASDAGRQLEALGAGRLGDGVLWPGGSKEAHAGGGVEKLHAKTGQLVEEQDLSVKASS